MKRADQHPSIAVLPFANMSRDPDDQYFSDGLAEEVINLLAHIPELKVTARTSSFAFRGKEQDIRRIADSLSVRTILEGTLLRSLAEYGESNNFLTDRHRDSDSYCEEFELDRD